MQRIIPYPPMCCIAAITMLFSCSNSQVKIRDSQINTSTRIQEPVAAKRLEMRTYLNTESKSSGWGYDIYMDSKLYIHQPHMPAISSQGGFKTEEQAKKVGNFVIKKIENNIIPPTVSKEELDSL